MRIKILSAVLSLVVVFPAVAKDASSPMVVPSLDCDERLEKALRTYDEYERQDADTVQIPIEDWKCMHQKMQEMRMHKNPMPMGNGSMQHMMRRDAMPMHGQFNH